MCLCCFSSVLIRVGRCRDVARRSAQLSWKDPHRARRSPGRVRLDLISVVLYVEVLYVTCRVFYSALFTILNPSNSAAHSAEPPPSKLPVSSPTYKSPVKTTQTQSGKISSKQRFCLIVFVSVFIGFNRARTAEDEKVCPSLGWLV